MCSDLLHLTKTLSFPPFCPPVLEPHLSWEKDGCYQRQMAEGLVWDKKCYTWAPGFRREIFFVVNEKFILAVAYNHFYNSTNILRINSLEAYCHDLSQLFSLNTGRLCRPGPSDSSPIRLGSAGTGALFPLHSTEAIREIEKWDGIMCEVCLHFPF